MPYKMAQQYLAELVDVLEYIHGKGIAHRDIKPENCLLDDKMHIKLSDFGGAKMCIKQGNAGDISPQVGHKGKSRRGTLVGTPEYYNTEPNLLSYAAPEVLMTQASDTTADLWSLGCVAYEFLTGKPPFKPKETATTFERIITGDLEFPQVKVRALTFRTSQNSPKTCV